MAKCPECGHDVPGSAVQCPRCGTRKSVVCTACRGKGLCPHTPAGATHSPDCPCKGSGVCAKCRGTGYQDNW